MAYNGLGPESNMAREDTEMPLRRADDKRSGHTSRSKHANAHSYRIERYHSSTVIAAARRALADRSTAQSGFADENGIPPESTRICWDAGILRIPRNRRNDSRCLGRKKRGKSEDTSSGLQRSVEIFASLE